MVFRVFVKTPLFWSIFLLFGVVFNYHAFDLGETYVSRNLSAWAVIFLSLIILWWRPFKRGELAWTPFGWRPFIAGHWRFVGACRQYLGRF